MSIIATLVPPGAMVEGSDVPLDEAEVHHLRVRRIPTGSAAVAFDGQGAMGEGEIVFGGRGLAFRAHTVQRVASRPRTILAVAAGDKDRFLLLAEKCTELGATHLVPLQTEHSQTVETRLRPASVDKARRRALEACKQCANPWATQVTEMTSLSKLAGSFPGVRWMLAAQGGSPLHTVEPDEAIGWIIGPEGGLTSDESALVQSDLGAVAVSLGHYTLRFETAAMAAATLTSDRRASAKETKG